jgi:hypothetical protein
MFRRLGTADQVAIEKDYWAAYKNAKRAILNGKTMIWNWYKDEWLVTRQAAKLFAVSAVLVLALLSLLFISKDTAQMSFGERLPLGILGVLGPIAAFFLWFGMWRYWVRLDRSTRMTKRMWFVVLLLGLWWGSCLYCFFVYLPQVYRRARAEAI